MSTTTVPSVTPNSENISIGTYEGNQFVFFQKNQRNYYTCSFIHAMQIPSLVVISIAYNERQTIPKFTHLHLHIYSLSSGWNTRARTSILSRAGKSAAALESTNAVCGTRLALPSVLLSKHLIKRTSSGVNPDL